MFFLFLSQLSCTFVERRRSVWVTIFFCLILPLVWSCHIWHLRMLKWHIFPVTYKTKTLRWRWMLNIRTLDKWRLRCSTKSPLRSSRRNTRNRIQTTPWSSPQTRFSAKSRMMRIRLHLLPPVGCPKLWYWVKLLLQHPTQLFPWLGAFTIHSEL